MYSVYAQGEKVLISKGREIQWNSFTPLGITLHLCPKSWAWISNGTAHERGIVRGPEARAEPALPRQIQPGYTNERLPWIGTQQEVQRGAASALAVGEEAQRAAQSDSHSCRL